MGLWKAFSTDGLAALLSGITQVRRTAEANTSAVSSLGGDLAELSTLTAQGLAGKQDKPSGKSVTIPAAGWASDSTAGYPQYYDLAVSGVTAKDRAKVDLAPEAQSTAAACGLCPTCETLAGKIRLRAAKVPTTAMAAQYWIEKGV